MKKCTKYVVHFMTARCLDQDRATPTMHVLIDSWVRNDHDQPLVSLIRIQLSKVKNIY